MNNADIDIMSEVPRLETDNPPCAKHGTDVPHRHTATIAEA